MLRNFSKMAASKSKRLILVPKNDSDVPVAGLIFDMDGTLCKPQVSGYLDIYINFFLHTNGMSLALN